MEKNNDYLLTAKIPSLIVKYSIPCIVSLLVAALYNIVDQLFIANADYLGAYGNAANNVVFPLTMVALAIATMIGDGCCTFASMAMGKGEKKEASKSVGMSISLLVISSLVIAAIYLLFPNLIIKAFGGDVNQETFDLSKEYFFWISLGIPFYMFGQGVNPIIRSDGNPEKALLVLLAGAIVNIILDPIFIFVLKLGMMGAAVATVAGQIVSAVLSLFFIVRMKTMKIEKSSFAIKWSYVKRIVALGFSSFLSQISVVLSMAAVLNMLKKYGMKDPIFSQPLYAHIPVAVVGIVMKLFQIVISMAIGLAAGCIPVVGYNNGAGRSDRVIKIMKTLMVIELALGLVSSIILVGGKNILITIFGGNGESIYYTQFAQKAIISFLSLLILSTFNKGATIFLQAAGDAKSAAVLSVLREIVMGVGLPILLPIFFGLDGILWFMPIGDFITAIFAVVCLHKREKSIKEQPVLSI
ncbi:MAG: MATE family efflux transporter [Candidatus Ornithospirochaeta sp.]